MNKLIIIEDNLDFSRTLINYISSKIQKIQLYKFFIDGEEIFNILSELDNNDIILLDLEMPKINGIKVIELLKRNKAGMPYIIVISGNSSLIKKSNEYIKDIYRIFEKPFKFEKIVDSINEIVSQFEVNNLETKIKNELSLFNFNTSTIGYIYLVECIKLALKDSELLSDIKNNLYLKVSKNHKNSNILKVKWSIEKSIDSLYKNTNINILDNYFYIEMQQKLTPKLFITTVVNKLNYNL